MIRPYNGYQWTELSSFGLDGDSDGTHNKTSITSGTKGGWKLYPWQRLKCGYCFREMYIDDFVANQVLSYSEPV